MYKLTYQDCINGRIRLIVGKNIFDLTQSKDAKQD